MRGISGSGPFGAEAQMLWLGHPLHASPCPACSDSGPGQCSGSGATSSGAAFRGAERADLTEVVTSRSASRVGAMSANSMLICSVRRASNVCETCVRVWL
jgi:hypothetical protein